MGITGKEGEEMAAQFLTKKGYHVITRNFRCPYGEIDLIAWEKGTLVFIEVKSRAQNNFGGPEGAVNRRKQEKISRVAAAYLQRHNLHAAPCRFDVVGIVQKVPTVLLFRNAFEMSPSLSLL